MPPSAAATARAAFRGCASSPASTSRLISRPTTKKKMAMSPSFTHKISGFSITSGPPPTVRYVPQRAV